MCLEIKRRIAAIALKSVPPSPCQNPLELSKRVSLLNHKAVRVCVWKQGIGNINRIQNEPAVYQMSVLPGFILPPENLESDDHNLYSTLSFSSGV